MKAAKKLKSIAKEAARELVSAVGVDLGDRWSHWCALSSTGEVIERGRVKTTAEDLSELAAGWIGVQVAIENGTHSGWISRTLEKAGCIVWVANPSRWRGTAHSSKNDANDAEALARVVRVDPKLLFPITHRTQEQQEDLSVIRIRAQLVRARTMLVNTARGVVKTVGARLPATDADAFHNTSWQSVPEALREALRPLYQSLAVITEQVRALDRRIEQLSKEKYQATTLLRSVPGVGPVTALTYVLTLGDAERFSTSRDAGAFLGLRPRQRQSGSRNPELGIAKNGDNYLRGLLVECAQYVLSRGPDSVLKRWGLGLAQAGPPAKRRALVAVARKLAVLLHCLWSNGELYCPFPESVVPSQPGLLPA
ncbi:IS110 family RNA-guided transposase [Granulicella paludicola]|uniref:IS110 family transposase n=1 Tax=Granulicella paludicola TaxID=474951 RepID=UPI0021DF42F7|nr:IS110 family transposase [Granulicella paludicola]